MSNPIVDNMSLLLLMASTATAELCTGKNAEDCKVNNTARLTWTLLGVLMLINLLLFCMLVCTWYYLCTRMRDLRRKIGNVSAPRRVAGNGYVVFNRNSEPGNPASRTQASTNTMNTSVSVPIALSSHNKAARNSSDYSTVIDAIESYPSHGKTYSVSKKIPPLSKHSTSAAGQSAHPFSNGANATNAVSKAVSQKRPQRVAPSAPIPIASKSDPKAIGELEHSYDNIVDGLSPPEDADSADPKSPPNSTAKTTTSTHTTKNTTTTTATTIMVEEEIESDVYSTPIPDGIKNYRRMTASKQSKDAVISESKTATRKKYSRPKSALGLYPPMDDIYTSSCNSSPSSVRKKMRPVSAYYNEPV